MTPTYDNGSAPHRPRRRPDIRAFGEASFAGTGSVPRLRRVEPVAERANPLEQLVVAQDALRPWSSLHDQDHMEALDATHEDANGRLPHEDGYGK